MGYSFGGPIVTSGLILSVDGADNNSYPDSGTTWTDLINSRNGTLTNSPSFTTDKGGAIDFDGSNDYVTFGDDDAFSFGDGSNDSPLSIDAWINMDDATNFTVLVKGTYQNTGEFHFRTNASDKLHLVLYEGASYQAQLPDTAQTSLEGQWINVTATYNGVGGGSANEGIKFYINSAIQATSAATGGSYTAMENGSVALEIGRESRTSASSYTYSNGKIACVRLYGKELSQNEINQNFNAQRSRFGV